MFTGIVTHRARVVEARPVEGVGRRLVLAPLARVEGVGLGDSIAVDGVCLTVAAQDDERLAFDVVGETLRRTTLGERAAGDLVNLEPSLRLGDEMGGHIVQGHVEGTGRVVDFEQRGEDVRLVVALGRDLFAGLIPKGSVAVDGVSLTLGEVWQDAEDGDGGRFAVYLVPHTLAVTGLGARRPPAGVNVEPDVLGRWVEHHVRRILGAGVPGGADPSSAGAPAPRAGKAAP